MNGGFDLYSEQFIEYLDHGLVQECFVDRLLRVNVKVHLVHVLM